jgi:lipopolysaccharide transport system permease protein
MSVLSTYRDSRELLLNLTLRELRSKYKRSFLGWAWSLVTPLATMTVYSVVFSKFFRARPANGVDGLHYFALWLMCALLPWTFFSTGLMATIGSLVSNSNLISKSYFDRRLLPASTVMASLVSHLIEMGLLVVVLAAFDDWQAVAFIPVLLLLIGMMAMVTLGTGMLLSALNVYFRDIEHFMSILLLVWFYLTPIIYPIKIAVGYTTLLKMNPMTEATNCFRSVLYYGHFPTAVDMCTFAGFAVVMLGIGAAVFGRLQPGFAEEL